MCSRCNLTSPPEAVRAYFGHPDTPNFPARYNIAPTQPIAVVARDREGVRRFGRNAMRWRRCLVPADGFYEWTGEKGKRRPFLLRPREPHLIAFAGIYEHWRDGKGEEIDTVAILTCPSNSAVLALPDRMPVVLPPEHFAAWLDVKGTSPEEAAALLQPVSDDLF